MSSHPYRILARQRAGEALSADEIHDVVHGAADGGWADAQLGAFLMAVAIQGLSPEETRLLTREMLDSGDRWRLADEVPDVGDKHSTGGVGDKVSLILAPLCAATGRPVAMLTGRGLGHTGGTADKLESIPGLALDLDRPRALQLLSEVGMAVGVATADIAPADRRLYALRDVTATIDSLPLITASILSKKLATGAAGVVYDVKTGSGAFLPERQRAQQLAAMLVETSNALGTPARALITDMSQPLGRWVGHAAEVREALECLAGDGPADLMQVTLSLAGELAELTGRPLADGELERAWASGRAREAFDRWAAAQGAEAGWARSASLELAPVEAVVAKPAAGRLARVATREIGLLLAEAGGGRRQPGDAIDHGVALKLEARLGDEVAAGEALARLYLRREDDSLVRRMADCFELAEPPAAPSAPPLIYDRL